MAKLPLEGIRIADITVIWAGTYATMLLADWGAEVIRVESLQHFQLATRGPMARPTEQMTRLQTTIWLSNCGRVPGKRPWNTYALFNIHARNKLSMTVNLTKPEGRDIFRRLIEKSDVFLESNSPSTPEALKLTYDFIEQWNPRIIMLSMPSFGSTGPYKYYRTLGAHQEGFIGHSYLKGYSDMDLTANGLTFVIDECAGANAAAAVLMALHWRNRTGKGIHIDMAQSESGIPYLTQALMDYVMNGRVQERMGNRSPYGVQGCYRCRGHDRWINVSIFNDEQWEGLCRAMGNPEWTREERFSDQLSRMKNHNALDNHIGEWTQNHDDYALMHLLQGEGVPAGPVVNERDALNDPHLKERDFFQPADQEDCGRHLYPGPAWKMSKTPNQLRTGPVRLGEHNEYVYKKVLGVSDEEYVRLQAGGHIGMDYVPEIP